MSSENNRRIAKNTLFLYIRMLITMLVGLYTSRVVLNILGVEDFGIYNIVGGVVVLFSFLNNAMSNATLRFLSYEIGKENTEQIKKTFKMSMTAHISIAILAFLLLETVGLWFVNTYLNIPVGRMYAANWVYQFSIFTFIVNIIRIPYNASIIAYENMSFFAYVSILEVLLKLFIVFLLFIIGFDKLISYAFLVLVVTFFVTIIFKLYCTRKFSTCHYNFFWDKDLYFKLMSFSGWSMLSSVANIGAQQGGNIILNIFNGVIANAAYGVANQASNAIYGFVNNFQLAFKPQIIKLYAAGETGKLHVLMFRTSLFSYYLFLIIAIPFLVNTEEVLQLWLKTVPEYAVVFCQLMILYFLIDSIQAPLWTAIYATGNIRSYQLWYSFLVAFNIPLAYTLLKMGMPPYYVLIVRVGLNFISAIIRTIYLSYFMNFPAMKYFKSIVLRAAMVTILAYFIARIINNNSDRNFTELLLMITLTVGAVIGIIYIIGINKKERMVVNSYVKNVLNRKE